LKLCRNIDASTSQYFKFYIYVVLSFGNVSVHRCQPASWRRSRYVFSPILKTSCIFHLFSSIFFP
jgi:hypothetical protein